MWTTRAASVKGIYTEFSVIADERHCLSIVSVREQPRRGRLRAIRRVTEEFKERTAPRKTFHTFNGFGTTLLDYRALPDGTYEATRWAVALMLPIVPLATYTIEPQTQEHS